MSRITRPLAVQPSSQELAWSTVCEGPCSRAASRERREHHRGIWSAPTARGLPGSATPTEHPLAADLISLLGACVDSPRSALLAAVSLRRVVDLTDGTTGPRHVTEVALCSVSRALAESRCLAGVRQQSGFRATGARPRTRRGRRYRSAGLRSEAVVAVATLTVGSQPVDAAVAEAGQPMLQRVARALVGDLNDKQHTGPTARRAGPNLFLPPEQGVLARRRRHLPTMGLRPTRVNCHPSIERPPAAPGQPGVRRPDSPRPA